MVNITRHQAALSTHSPPPSPATGTNGVPIGALRHLVCNIDHRERLQHQAVLPATPAYAQARQATVYPVTTPDQPPLWQSLQPILPLVLFLGVNRVAGLRWAVVAATLWSVKVVFDRRRQNLPLGRALPLITAAVILRGVAGVITNSEVVYFGLGIATKYVASAVLLGSAMAMRPLGDLALRRGLGLSPQLAAKPAIASAARWATVVAGLYYLCSATFDVWLLERSSIDGFVVVRFLVNWPLGIAALGAIYWLFSRGFQAVPEAPDLVDALDARLEELGASR